MKFWKLVLPLLFVLSGLALKAEDAVKPAETKPTELGDLPKAPEGISPLNAAQSESLVGTLHRGAPPKGKGGKKVKGAVPDPNALVLVVEPAKKVKGDKEANKPKTITLSAEGAVLAQLNAFADKNATVKVTGALNGETMTVKEATEAPAPEKKKKKNNA